VALAFLHFVHLGWARSWPLTRAAVVLTYTVISVDSVDFCRLSVGSPALQPVPFLSAERIVTLRHSSAPESTLTWNAPVCKRKLRKRLTHVSHRLTTDAGRFVLRRAAYRERQTGGK
jgi:hypothetical protein